MNLAIRGIGSDNIRWNNEGSFLNNAHKDLRADYVLANPPFNDSDWSGELLQNDARWRYGVPPAGNANFAWVQHFLFHLSQDGIAGFVLGNSSLSATNTGDGNIRKAIIEADLLDCIIVLPGQLFYNTTISACLWILTKDKGKTKKYRKRNNEVLLIDARKKGFLVEKTQRVLTENEIELIRDTYHNWKTSNNVYEDFPGLCKSVSIDEVSQNDFNLSPNKYIELDTELNVKIDFPGKISHLIKNIRSDQEMRLSFEHEIQSSFEILGLNDLSMVNYSNLSNKNLLELSRTLFHHWFIDFEFPYNKGNTLKQSNGRFADSIHGLIPEGWYFDTLSKATTVVDCLHTKKPEKIFEDTGKLLLQVYNIADEGLLDLSEKFFISEDDYSQWTKNIELCEGDCIITNTGRIGAVAQIPYYGRYAIGRNITAIRPNLTKISPAYLINYLLSAYMQIETYRETDIGTILDSLNVKGIKRVKILIPPRPIIDAFESFARPIRKIIEINNAEAYQLINNQFNDEPLSEE